MDNVGDMQPKRLDLSVPLVGDSISAGLSKYQTEQKRYFRTHRTLNCGSQTQKVLSRVEELSVLPSTEYIVVHCSTNNLDYDEPKATANAITTKCFY